MRVRAVLAFIFLAFASITCLSQGIIAPRASDKQDGLPALLPVTAIKIDARIDNRVAKVKVEHLFRNDTDQELEGTYYFPVPEGATLIEFAVYYGDERRVGRVKEKEEAKSSYAGAASRGEDPAILEMTRRGWFQSRIYPIPPHSEKRIEIVYSHILDEKDSVYTFDYPLGQGYKKLRVPVGEVHINIDLGSDVAIKNVFSPTHPLDLNFDGDRRVTGKIVTAGGGDAENFKLVYALTDDDIGMSLLTHRKEGEDGYFLLMLSPKVEFDSQRISAKDVVFVIDFSSSMDGDKIRQAKKALKFGLTRTLGENDRFNIIVFGSEVIPMEKRLIQATPANIARALKFVAKRDLLSATNINDALVTAMGMFERGARPQNLVFITDGRPTARISDPDQIVANTRAANTANARLFTFGVGRDVNRLLLERLALENRGAESNIADESKLEMTVSSFFAKVSQPVLSNLSLDFGPLHVDRVHPAQLPDLYTRTQIKIFGRYKNEEDLRDTLIALTGQMHEEIERFEFGGLNFPLVSKDKDFLPKLWATERVEALLAEIRLYGERPELRQEVIDLAREFNLVTPYTSMYVPTTAEMEQERAAGVAQGKSYNLDGSDPRSDQTATATANRQISQLPLDARKFQSLQLLAGLAPPGTVVDSSGAVIAGATITIKDQNTGATRTVTTDSAGNYSVSGLPPGTYRIEVDAPGFNKTQVENVVVQPGQVASTGVQLSPGAVTETVTVMAVATAIDSNASHTSSNYESKKLRDLPSLAPVDSFARLAPGATSREASEVNRQTGGSDKNAEFRLWFNGGRARSNSFTFDGQDNNDIDGRPALSINNFDSVESLHVLTTRSAGDVGLTGASSINLISRAGTNEFHGTIFDYHLNRRLGALSPLERRSGLERAPEFKNTIYGGTLGGPLRRDRVFFFAAFQGETESSGHFIDSTSSRLTPTQKGLEQLARLFPSSATVGDLIRRGPLARTDGDPQISRAFLLPLDGVPVEFGQVTRIFMTSTEGYEAGARFDFNLTRRDTLYAGYWYDSRSASSAVGRLASGYAGETDSRTHLGSLRWNRLLSPNSSNEFLFGVHRARLSLDPESRTSNETDESLSSPSVLVGFRGLSYGYSPFASSSHASTVFELSDVLSKVAGRHNLKLGAQVRRRLTDFVFLPGRSGQYTYATFEDFVLDRPAAFAVAIGDPRSEFRETHHHYFIDDAWRVRRNLTFTLGLSYENASQPLNRLADRVRRREENPGTALFDTTLPLDQRTIARVDRDNNNIAPRIGFAYTPHFLVFGKNIFGYDRTVIRGGMSISYDQTAYRLLAETVASSPNVLLASLTPASGTALPQFPNIPSRSELLSSLGGDARRFARTALAGNYRTPLSSSWHLTVTRDLNKRLVLEAGYAGTRGVGLIRAIDASPDGGGGPLRVYETTGRSIYHSFQLRADARLTDQFSGGLAYTLSKLIDNVPDNAADIAGGVGDPASFDVSGLQSLAQNPFDASRSERALSSFDRRHRLAAHFVYSLPLARQQSGLTGRLLGGWQASGIVSLASGSPFTPLQYISSSAGSASIFAAMFSERLGAVRPFASNPVAPADAVAFSNAANTFYRFFLNADGTPFTSPTGFIVADRSGFRAGTIDQARFVYNDYSVEQAARAMGLAPGAFGATFAAGRQFGDAGRNTLVGPRPGNVDFALLKTTKLSEKVSLQFRAEFFNLFNHPNRIRPNLILENAGGFGYADLGETDATPRRVRLALKLIF